MPDILYLNQIKDLSYEVFVKDRDTKQLTRPTISSGTFTLLGGSGQAIVPTSTATVTAPNKLSFRARPGSGTSDIGAYSEIWEAFIGQEVSVYVTELTVRERF